jgi:hypothetical protein
MNVTRERLAQFAAIHPREGWPNPAKWLLDNGRDFELGPLPPRVRMRKAKRCYVNAISLVGNGGGRYVYVEGWATSASCSSLSTSHAWCYDRETGLIVDTTWKDGFDYVGVPIRQLYAFTEVVRNGAVIEPFDDAGYTPIIRGAIPRDVWEELL